MFTLMMHNKSYNKSRLCTAFKSMVDDDSSSFHMVLFSLLPLAALCQVVTFTCKTVVGTSVVLQSIFLLFFFIFSFHGQLLTLCLH